MKIILISSTIILSTGVFCSMELYKKVGYLGTYSVSLALFLFCIIYVIVRIKDTRGPMSKHRNESEMQERARISCSQLFDVNYVYSAFVICFKNRENKGRFKILIIILSLCLLVFSFGKYLLFLNMFFLYCCFCS